MNKSQFIERRERRWRYGRTILWSSIFALIVFAVILALLPIQMSRSKIILITVPISLLIASIPTWTRDKELCCPSCRKDLSGTIGTVVIATGNCGFCGERFLDKDPESEGASIAGPSSAPES